MAKFTGELKLPTDWTMTEMFPQRVCLTISGVGALGLALIVKSAGAGVTTNVTTTLLEICGNAEFPVMVKS
jgi:hypothetical protein